MKTALITGSNSQLGIAIAKRLIKDDYKIVAHYHKDSSRIDVLKEKHSDIKLIRAEFNREGVKQMLNDIGDVDLLVNNAATVVKETILEDIDWDVLEKAFGVNLFAPVVISAKVFESMKNRGGGKIINISSIGAKYGGGETTMQYGLSKAGLDALTVNLARQGAKYNIIVNSVRPGVIDTDFHSKNTPSKNMEQRVATIPLKRMARPEEIAGVVAFLASDEADYITGQIISVSGGE